MPLKSFQQNYWNLSDTAAPPPTPTGRGGYPGWQASVVGSLWGAMGELAGVWWARLVWWMTTLRRVWRMDPDLVTVALNEAQIGLHGVQTQAPPEIRYVEVPVTVTERVEVPVEKTVIVEKRVEVPVEAKVGEGLILARQIRLLPEARQKVVRRAVELLEDPRFELAQAAVKETAHAPGFHRSESWRSLTHLLKQDTGRAENMYRHVNALEMARTRVREQGSTISNPALNLLVELAYHEYTVTKGR